MKKLKKTCDCHQNEEKMRKKICNKKTCDCHRNEEKMRKFSEIAIGGDGHANQNVAKNGCRNLERINESNQACNL